MTNRSNDSPMTQRNELRPIDELEAACLHASTTFGVSGQPSTPPIVPTAVWECESPAQADAILSGQLAGYVYQRDGHPNATWLAERVQELHRASFAAITSSGMAALAATLLAHAQSGDRVLISSQLYGRSTLLMQQEAKRLGITPIVADIFDPKAVAAAFEKRPKLALVETIANPRLRVAPLEQLAAQAHAVDCLLVVDNTFATPLVCRPLDWGADVVYESVSKLMNGHGDLMLGAVAANARGAERVAQVISTWGFASGPFEAWLAQRGLGTLGLRIERACDTAMQLARFSQAHSAIKAVDYPGLESHPDHRLACQLFGSPQNAARFGHVVTVHLKAGGEGASDFIRNTKDLPFCPSLGELRTTVSHPTSTSHRGMSEEARASFGIEPGTIRVSVGIEPTSWVLDRWGKGLDSLDRNASSR